MVDTMLCSNIEDLLSWRKVDMFASMWLQGVNELWKNTSNQNSLMVHNFDHQVSSSLKTEIMKLWRGWIHEIQLTINFFSSNPKDISFALGPFSIFFSSKTVQCACSWNPWYESWGFLRRPQKFKKRTLFLLY